MKVIINVNLSTDFKMGKVHPLQKNFLRIVFTQKFV